jgi:omega-hydroxy-beta-dihydromenaquinone-9 sulfotransferase
VAIVGCTWVLYRHGEQQAADDAAVAASFKRIMPFSNLLAFAPIDRWLAELVRARFRIGLAYLPRLVFTLLTSLLTTLVSLPERLLAPRLFKRAIPPPVFIIGMHRSGTTYLHELLALDPQFRSPRNYEVFNPHGFLTGWLTTAAMTPLLMWRRPMDAVQMTVLSSQEEEFALAAMGAESPYWMFCFPKRVAAAERYWQPERFTAAELARWKQHYRTFLRKLTWRTSRRPLLKNPVNTGRVATLRAMFPEAKFVYIVRHPYAVYQSNRHFAEHGFAVFQLQDADPEDSYERRFLAAYRRATDACERDLAALPSGTTARTRLEDLEADAVGEIERMYRELGFELTATFRTFLAQQVEAAAGYRKNRFPELPDSERQKVDAAMGDYLVKWGYDSHPHRVAA